MHAALQPAAPARRVTCLAYRSGRARAGGAEPGSPLRYNPGQRMIELYSPRGEMELLMLRSIFDDAGIPYYVRNDSFGSLYLLRYAEAYNRKTLCVARVDREEASFLVREFLRRTDGGAEQPAEAPAAEAAPPGRLLAGLLAVLGRWIERTQRREDPADELRRRFRVIRNDEPQAAAEAGDGSSDGGTAPPLRIV